MKHKSLKVAAIVAVLATVASVERAQGQGMGTDQLLACLNAASDAFVTCVDEHAWYVAPLCELRYNVDALLCVPALALKGYIGGKT